MIICTQKSYNREMAKARWNQSFLLLTAIKHDIESKMESEGSLSAQWVLDKINYLLEDYKEKKQWTLKS